MTTTEMRECIATIGTNQRELARMLHFCRLLSHVPPEIIALANKITADESSIRKRASGMMPIQGLFVIWLRTLTEAAKKHPLPYRGEPDLSKRKDRDRQGPEGNLSKAQRERLEEIL
jgi:hypothetical protein